MPADLAFAPEATASIQASLEGLLARQRDAFLASPNPSAEQRRAWLKALRRLLIDEQEAIIAAISEDFGNRSADETRMAEIMPAVMGIHFASKHLKTWMKPSKRTVGLAFQPAAVRVLYQPLGVVGVIVPWNYPLLLAVGPLTGALAAGNRVMIKMSESTPAFSQLLKELLARIFPEDLVAVVTGEMDVGVAFSKLPFDHLLFTGATSVGKHVMRAAAENLTPVTLELGGKSPAIISAEVPMQHAAERIAWGKTLNAGQTCIAPDYVLVPEGRRDEFVEQYRIAVQRFYPTLKDNPDYTAIINGRQQQRLEGYLRDAEAQGARIVQLFPEAQGRRLPHALVLDIREDMKVMQEEIFGPLLPVLTYRDLGEALDYINQRPRPLALYYFGYDRAEQEEVLERTRSGGVCLNDTLLHMPQDDAPFGGIGDSGMGHYHGHEGFKTFSTARTVFSKRRFNAARLIYPPYGKLLQKLVYRLFIR